MRRFSRRKTAFTASKNASKTFQYRLDDGEGGLSRNMLCFLCILGLRHNPKILWVDDAKVVGDRITEVRLIPRNFLTQELKRRIRELGASRVGFIVRDMLVHHAP